MIVTYRTEPLNYNVVTKNIINGLKNYCNKYGIKNLVLGISGGIDSTVVAALTKLAGINLIGISMPCTTNEECENESARLVGEEFCSEFKVVNLQSTFEVMEKFCTDASGRQSTPISQGNIKARLRMTTVYDIASKVGGIALDTDNLTEHFLGFFTLHGDTCDLTPIGGLWKHEVYELAKYLKENHFKDSKALEASIALIPTDGNGVKAGGDLAQIAPGKTYDDVDEILHAWVGLVDRIKAEVIEKNFDYGVFKALCEKHGKETVEAVVMRSARSEFKRKHMPFVIDIFNGNTLDGEGNIFVS